MGTIENHPIEKVPGFEQWYDVWKKAINDRPECQRFYEFKFQIDLFVQSPETPRSHSPHFHPMPLITTHFPINPEFQYKDYEEEIVGRAFVVSDAGRVQVPDRTFLPLAPGTIHHESAEFQNKIFVVISPITDSIEQFRSLRNYQKTQAKMDANTRSLDDWLALDSLHGGVQGFKPEFLNHEEQMANTTANYVGLRHVGVSLKVDKRENQDDGFKLGFENFSAREWNERLGYDTDFILKDQSKESLESLLTKMLKILQAKWEPAMVLPTNKTLIWSSNEKVKKQCLQAVETSPVSKQKCPTNYVDALCVRPEFQELCSACNYCSEDQW